MLHIPTPPELGFPPKFDAWRPAQVEALRLLLTSKKRVKALSAPTGFGKTAVYMAFAILTKLPTCFVTDSRALQDQLLCIAPKTKICTGDLRWVRADSVAVGDTLLGFDQFRSPNRRMWRPSTISGIEVIFRPCYKLTLIDKTEIVCSSEHRWLSVQRRGQAPIWRHTHELTECNDYILKVLDPWEYTQDFETGYLAAAFDGEGHLHQSKSSHKGAPNGVDVNLSFAQVDNPMLLAVEEILRRKEFPFTVIKDNRNSQNCKHANCNRLTISGRRDTLRFLGQIRPTRLLPKLDLNLMGMMNPARRVLILKKQYLGERPVVSIKTSTGTYVAEGFASHNCDFQGLGLVDIRGRRNYTCDMKEDYTCEDGYAARCPYKGTVGCPASDAEMRAATSFLVVTNYDKWTSARKYGQGMAHFQQVVFDEGHQSPDALARAMQVTLSHREIGEGLGLEFPAASQTDEFVNWKPWAAEARVIAEDAMREAQQRLQEPGVKPAWIRHFLHMRNLSRRLATISTAVAKNWVVDAVDVGYQFDPVRVGAYAEGSLLLRVPSILVVSATLRPKTLFMLGVGRDHFDFKEFNSDFDPRRCPIYYIPTMRVDSRATDLSVLWMRLDQIAARRHDRKGIVHTISYARRDEILETSRFAPHMLINTKGEASTRIIEEYRRSPAGTILVSPAVGAGFDFPGKDCEWQFVCKIPFPDGRSKIVRARQEDDKEYGPYQAINKLVQIFGRGMRSREDQCENFIGDCHLDWFLPKYSHLAPMSFRGFFKKVEVLPQPPPRL